MIWRCVDAYVQEDSVGKLENLTWEYLGTHI